VFAKAAPLPTTEDAMEHSGVDLGKRQSQIAILTEDGELSNLRIRTERQRLAELFGRRPKGRILLEASTESEWVARCLEDLGHEVIVADPNYAPMYARRTRRVKTDRRDAPGWVGWPVTPETWLHIGSNTPPSITLLPRSGMGQLSRSLMRG